MSKQELRQHSCERKVGYDSEWEAIHAAAIARERTRHKSIGAYKCWFCPRWHMGHSNKNENNTIDK